MVKSDTVMDGSFGSSSSSSSSGVPVADRQDDLPCQFCSKKFQSQDALEAHLKTKHPFRSSAKLHGNSVSLDAFLGELITYDGNLKSITAFSSKIDLFWHEMNLYCYVGNYPSSLYCYQFITIFFPLREKE